MPNPLLIDAEWMKRLKMFEFITLLAPAEILSKIGTPDELTLSLGNYDERNAKTYYLAQCLLELQQAGFALGRWNVFAEKIAKDNTNRIERAELSSIIVDVNAWQRKLTEILSRVICFSRTNEEQYYYYYLLCEDLIKCLHEMVEQRDNFGCDSAILAHRYSTLMEEIKRVEHLASFRIADCWYLQDKKLLSERRSVKAGSLLCGLKTLVKFALASASHSERRALGYVYQYAFSHPSEALHFVPLPTNTERDIRRFNADLSRISLISVDLAARCQHLLNIFPADYACQQVMHAYRNPYDGANPFVRNFVIGDFIIVDFSGKPFLAEILDAKENELSYAIYKVRFLRESPVSSIEIDWIAANRCSLFMQQASLYEQTFRLLAETAKHVSEETKEQLMDRENITEASRQAVAEIWEKAKLQELLIARAKQTHGMQSGAEENAQDSGNP